MRRALFVLAIVAVCWPRPASALTVHDVIELARAGLGEDTLLALIEVDPSVFPLDVATMTSLKTAGVSERVIVAMVRSGRGAAPAPAADYAPPLEAPAAGSPQVIVIEHYDRTPEIREVVVPVSVPVYIPVARSHDVDRNDGARDAAHRPPEQGGPVYWGWGGKLRPDAWQPR